MNSEAIGCHAMRIVRIVRLKWGTVRVARGRQKSIFGFFRSEASHRPAGHMRHVKGLARLSAVFWG